MRFFLIIAAILLANFSNLKADTCLDYAGEVGVGYDYFRGLAEGSWEGNTGALISCNLGVFTSYPAYPDVGCIGAQAGGSYGVYDWSGRGPVPAGPLRLR